MVPKANPKNKAITSVRPELVDEINGLERQVRVKIKIRMETDVGF